MLNVYGAGNGPDRDLELLAALREATDRGVGIVVRAQFLRGTVDLRAYETGSALADAEAISGDDMTAEAALTKLSYLIAIGESVEVVRRLMPRNLRGELTGPK